MIDLDELQRAAMRRLRGALTRDVNRHSREMVAAVELARLRCDVADVEAFHAAQVARPKWRGVGGGVSLKSFVLPFEVIRDGAR